MVDDEDPTTAGTASRPDGEDWLAGAFVIALDPEWFGGAERYRTTVARVLGGLRQQPPADGFEEILIPGDPERRSRERRAREGIPLADPVWSDLVEIGSRYGVVAPG
jgi:LDH2 family malate/lactate/ureidoglycolate dehydrogenase